MIRVIMLVMAVGVVIGGVDELAGNRLGLGQRFREGFLVLGQTALAMVGIICLEPLLASGLRRTIAPLLCAMGLDPAILGGVLAIDMGGYQMAKSLATSPAIGLYAGVVIASTLGCTLTFSIPIGMAMIRPKDQPIYARGILLGLMTCPVGMLVGGAMEGLPLITLLWQTLPVTLLVVVLLVCLTMWQAKVIKAFLLFSKGIRIVSTVGLILGAVRYLTGFTVYEPMISIEDALDVVAGISITLLGSLPIAELLRRLLTRPLSCVGKRAGLNSVSIVGMLVSIVSVTPSIAMFKDMDERGQIVNAAFLVSGASLFASHLGFTITAAPMMASSLLAAKLTGAITALALALWTTRSCKHRSGQDALNNKDGAIFSHQS